jgi:tonB-dependent outer membrane receptor
MKSYILLLGLLLGGFTAYADSTAKKETEAILIGHVVDSRSGEHLPFITITVKGTTIGTTTDVSGHYLLGNLPVGRPLTVVAQSVGYKSAERSVTLGAHSTTELNFELEEQPSTSAKWWSRSTATRSSARRRRRWSTFSTASCSNEQTPPRWPTV